MFCKGHPSIKNGAEEGTRTPTGFRPLTPQISVSTYSTTSAHFYLEFLPEFDVWVVFAFAFPTTEEGPFEENTHRERDVTIKRMASPVVIFERRVAVPLGPKRV